MNIIEFFNYIYSVLTGSTAFEMNELVNYFSNISHWTQIFNPPFFLGALVYILVGVFIIQFTMILPVRIAKRLIKYPSRKGSEFK